MGNVVVEMALSLLENLIIIKLIDYFLDVRSKVVEVAFIGFLVVLSLFLNTLEQPQSIFIVFVCLWLYASINYKDYLLNKLFVSTVIFGINLFFSYFFISFVSYRKPDIIEIFKSDIWLYISFVIMLKISLFLFVLYFKDKFRSIHRIINLPIFMLCILSFFISTINIFYHFIDGKLDPVGAIILLTIFAFLILVLFNNFKQRWKTTQEMSELKIQDEVLQEYIESLKQSQESIDAERKRLHDFKNILLLIKLYAEDGNTEKINDYLKDNPYLYTFSTLQVNTTNKFLNYLVTAKYYSMKQYNIEFTSMIEHDLSFIKDSDLMILLGNLFDNAIEAESRIAEERFIYFETSQNIVGNVYIEISNNNKGIKNETLSTSKSDKKAHGFGIIKIKEIISKYHGQYTIENEDIFFFRIMFIRSE